MSKYFSKDDSVIPATCAIRLSEIGIFGVTSNSSRFNLVLASSNVVGCGWSFATISLTTDGVSLIIAPNNYGTESRQAGGVHSAKPIIV